ncbi:hypothetical protein HDU85_000471 [Gaertneriomyces sp. JEL0708]|nr:hypothetical protein HDU85_000471 [Gaertneriomyces sp. JEL0708]
MQGSHEHVHRRSSHDHEARRRAQADSLKILVQSCLRATRGKLDGLEGLERVDESFHKYAFVRKLHKRVEAIAGPFLEELLSNRDHDEIQLLVPTVVDRVVSSQAYQELIRMLTTETTEAVSQILQSPGTSYSRQAENNRRPSYDSSIQSNTTSSSTAGSLSLTHTPLLSEIRQCASDLEPQNDPTVRQRAISRLMAYPSTDLVSPDFREDTKRALALAMIDSDQLVGIGALKVYARCFRAAGGDLIGEVFMEYVEAVGALWERARVDATTGLSTGDSLFRAFLLLKEFMIALPAHWIRFSEEITKAAVHATFALLSKSSPLKFRATPLQYICLIDPHANWFVKWCVSHFGRHLIARALASRRDFLTLPAADTIVQATKRLKTLETTDQVVLMDVELEEVDELPQSRISIADLEYVQFVHHLIMLTQLSMFAEGRGCFPVSFHNLAEDKRTATVNALKMFSSGQTLTITTLTKVLSELMQRPTHVGLNTALSHGSISVKNRESLAVHAVACRLMKYIARHDTEGHQRLLTGEFVTGLAKHFPTSPTAVANVACILTQLAVLPDGMKLLLENFKIVDNVLAYIKSELSLSPMSLAVRRLLKFVGKFCSNPQGFVRSFSAHPDLVKVLATMGTDETRCEAIVLKTCFLLGQTPLASKLLSTTDLVEGMLQWFSEMLDVEQRRYFPTVANMCATMDGAKAASAVGLFSVLFTRLLETAALIADDVDDANLHGSLSCLGILLTNPAFVSAFMEDEEPEQRGFKYLIDTVKGNTSTSDDVEITCLKLLHWACSSLNVGALLEGRFGLKKALLGRNQASPCASEATLLRTQIVISLSVIDGRVFRDVEMDTSFVLVDMPVPDMWLQPIPTIAPQVGTPGLRNILSQHLGTNGDVLSSVRRYLQSEQWDESLAPGEMLSRVIDAQSRSLPAEKGGQGRSPIESGRNVPMRELVIQQMSQYAMRHLSRKIAEDEVKATLHQLLDGLGNVLDKSDPFPGSHWSIFVAYVILEGDASTTKEFARQQYRTDRGVRCRNAGLLQAVVMLVKEELPAIDGAFRNQNMSMCQALAHHLDSFCVRMLPLQPIGTLLVLTQVFGDDYYVYFILAILRYLQPSILQAARDQDLTHYFYTVAQADLLDFSPSKAYGWMRELEKRWRTLVFEAFNVSL